MTSARFQVIDSFGIKGRGFVLAGRIIEGVIKPGMKLIVPPSPVLQNTQISEGVEFIKRIDGQQEVVGLVFASTDAREREAWAKLQLEGVMLKVEA